MLSVVRNTLTTMGFLGAVVSFPLEFDREMASICAWGVFTYGDGVASNVYAINHRGAKGNGCIIVLSKIHLYRLCRICTSP